MLEFLQANIPLLCAVLFYGLLWHFAKGDNRLQRSVALTLIVLWFASMVAYLYHIPADRLAPANPDWAVNLMRIYGTISFVGGWFILLTSQPVQRWQAAVSGCYAVNIALTLGFYAPVKADPAGLWFVYATCLTLVNYLQIVITIFGGASRERRSGGLGRFLVPALARSWGYSFSKWGHQPLAKEASK